MSRPKDALQPVSLLDPVRARDFLLHRFNRLPSVIAESTFDENGYVVEAGRCLMPAYVASPLGFNRPGQHFADTYLYPGLKEAGIQVFCPFKACGEYLNPAVFSETNVLAQRVLWEAFNRDVVPVVNYGVLMPRSKLLIAVLDGPHADEGVASEVAVASKLEIPVVGVRSDFRMGENAAASTNPAVDCFMSRLFTGPQAYEEMFSFLREQTKGL